MRSAILAIPAKLRPLGLASFPFGACGDASLLLGAYLADNGFEGFRQVQAERGSRQDDTWTSHAWLETTDLVVDITADQFSDAPAAIIVAEKSEWHLVFEIRRRGPSDFREFIGPAIPQLHDLYAELLRSIPPL